MKEMTLTFNAQQLQDLSTVCDTALKAGGLQILAQVNRLNTLVADAQKAEEPAQKKANQTPAPVADMETITKALNGADHSI